MTNSTRFLRDVLLADGLVCVLTGVILVGLQRVVASLIGAPPVPLLVTGSLLLAVGAGLVYSATTGRAVRTTALLAVALNLAWLAGTAVVVFSGWLTSLGNWALVLAGDVVIVFTILQVIGLRRLSRSTNPTLSPHRA